MRLALWHDLPHGGGRRALDELGARLGRDHDLVVYQLEGSSDVPRANSGRGMRTIELRHSPRPERRLGLFWNDWVNYQNIKALTELERRLAERIDAEEYDVVLASTLRGAYAPGILRFLRTPNAYYCHEPPRRFYEPWCRPEAGPLSVYERLRLLAHFPSRKLIDAHIRRSDVSRARAASALLTNSAYSAGRMETVYGRSASVSYLGVDTQFFRPDERVQQNERVLCVASFEPHKGLDFLIQALAKLAERSRPELILAGGSGHPRMAQVLTGLAQRLGVKLTIYQGLTDERLAALYRSASIFVFAARHEPFGLVLLEAMASGLPVVAVDEGGVREIVRHGQTGYLVSRRPESFAETVAKLIEAPGSRRKMGQEARTVVESHWTWDQATRRLERYLFRLAEVEQQPALEAADVCI